MRKHLGSLCPLAIFLLFLLPARETEARQDLAIHHAGMSCIPQSDFAVVVADVAPSDALRSVKLYFRSQLYPDFYYVEMKPFEEVFVGILPQPSEETRAIAYYIEIVDNAFNSTRTAEVSAPVKDPCSERKKAAAYLGGEDPGIIVGATTNGASALPPGFKAVGIIGTITAAGAAASLGGGIGAGTVVIAAAAAAGAGGAVVVATGGNASTTTVGASGSAPTSTVATTSVAGGAPPGGSTSTSTVPSSPTTSVGSTTTSPGPTTTVSPTTSSTTTTSLTTSTTTSVPASSTSTTTTTVAAAPVACFQVTSLPFCHLRLDANCSTGTIVQYDWQLDTGGVLNGPANRSGPVVEYVYSLPLFCVGRSVTNVLTVTGPGGQNSSTQVFRFLLQREDAAAAKSVFESTLVAADTSTGVSGTVAVNGRSSRVLGPPAPATVPFAGTVGRNDVEATWMPGFRGTGTWVFDFARAERFVPGSITAEQGEVLALEPTRIVFRLNGERPAPIRFHFDLAGER